jgi:hypothetical protein
VERRRGRPSEIWIVNPIVLNPSSRFSAILATEFEGDDEHRFSAILANGNKRRVENRDPVDGGGGDYGTARDGDDDHQFRGPSQLPFAINAKNPFEGCSADATRATRDADAKNAKNHEIQPEARLCSDTDEPDDDPPARGSGASGASGAERDDGGIDDRSDLDELTDDSTVEVSPADGSATKLLANGPGHLRCIVCDASDERVVRLDNGLCLHTESRSCVLAFNAMHDVVTEMLPAHGIELILDHGQLVFDREAGAQVPADLRAQIIDNPGLAAVFCRYER